MNEYYKGMIEDVINNYDIEENSSLEELIITFKYLCNENNQLKLINQEHQQINGELRQANKLLNEQYIRLYKEYEQVKEDIRNVISLLDKNCDDLEGTEDEFDSLDKYQNIGHQEYME